MQIREYKPTDREACFAVYNSNVPVFFAPEELDGFKSWLDSKDKAVLAHATNQCEYYYVIENDNKIIGCGGFYITQNKQEARMAWGMVENSLHKKGIGRQLLDYCIKQIKLLNPEVSIALYTTQHSYVFFERLGFKVTKIQKDFYLPGMDRYDMAQGG